MKSIVMRLRGLLLIQTRCSLRCSGELNSRSFDRVAVKHPRFRLPAAARPIIRVIP